MIEPGQIQYFVRAGCRQTQELGADPKVPGYRGVGCVANAFDAHPDPPGLRSEFSKGASQDPGVPRCWLDKSQRSPKGSRFSGSIFSKQANDAALLDGEAEVLDDFPAVERLGEVIEFQNIDHGC